MGRVPEVELTTDKGETLARLEPAHRAAVERCGFAWNDLWRAEQVHGDGVAVVPRESDGAPGQIVLGVDGLLTATPGVVLGIYVADCAAVYLSDRGTGALGLLHSGKKGTELAIAVRAVERMEKEFGTKVDDLEAAVSPCIRPPHYEIDFVVEIERQLLEAGIPRSQVVLSGVCTGTHADEYYSYRIEKGKTGRMLAFLGRAREGAPER